MLCKFDDICNDNNITYWLHGGTLLGSVRDKNFIAWDDDADVVMPRESFDRLRLLRKTLTDEDYTFTFPEDSKTFFDFIPGFYCEKFLVDQKINSSNESDHFRTSPKIDIFVIDECSDGFYHNLNRWRLVSKYLMARGHRKIKMNLDLKTNSLTNPILKLIAKVFEKFGAHKDYSKLLKEYESISKIENGKKCKYVYLSNDQPWFLYRKYSKEVFEGRADGFIQDKPFPIPIGYEDILSQSYGDYKVMVPENQRKPDHYLIK
jgi:lipopolysaccharide cholinephosphotransferase